MKYTFPVLNLSIGGAQRMLAELVNGLAQRGHDVTVLLPPGEPIEYPLRARVIRSSGASITAADFPKGDVIVSNFYTTVPAAQLASQHGKGLHVRLSLCYEPAFLPHSPLSFPSYHATPHLLVLSTWQQKIIQLNHGIRGHIVPVGVGPSFRNLGIRRPEDPPHIAAILRKPEGGFSWHRDQDTLIQALIQVKNRFPNIAVSLFCPPGELATSPILQHMASTGPFRVLTPKDDAELCYHYNEAHIFVSSSTYDAASLPGLEAMKCGAALVTAYSGGNADYCQHEANCLMSYRYENRLAHNVLRLIQDPTLRAMLAREGEREASRWTWERSVNAFEAAVLRILQGIPAP